MSIQTVESIACGSWRRRELHVNAVEENLTSDAGLIVFAQLDEQLGWTKQFASEIVERRSRLSHTRHSMVQQRVFGIIAGYEDQNDHDTLRSDPIFKLIANYDPGDDDLASQPTISRLENAVTAGDLLRMEDWFLDRFVESFEETPEVITLDIDTSDDPAHGQQQLTFFHGFYEQHQYLLRFITCDENDMVALPVLLFGNAVAKLGAADDLKRVIERVRTRFPDVPIRVRADSAFSGPVEYETLESLGVLYYMGMKSNPKSKRLTEDLLENAVRSADETGEPQLHYRSLPHYKSKYWKTSKTVVAKAEVTAHMRSRRYVITNDPDAETNPKDTYEFYAQRGESENRNKELKCDLMVDRLSDHRYMANLFRVMLHSLAHNLIVTMRSRLQNAKALTADTTNASASDEAASPSPQSPTKSRRAHNARRRNNVLAEAHPCTWRMLVIKVAARVVISKRRIQILLSASWPHAAYLRKAFSGL